jgi:hypothetical protein
MRNYILKLMFAFRANQLEETVWRMMEAAIPDV